MKLKITILLLTVVLFSAFICQALGSEGNEMAVVSLPIGNDLYMTGGQIVVTEPVTGDLMAVGGSLILNGSVGEDLQIAGGSLLVNSPVTDDLRAAGGDVIVSTSVGGDLVVFGGNVTIPAGAVVEGDAVIGAGNLNLGGTVRGNLTVNCGSMDFSGNVSGNAKMSFTDSARLNGDIEGETVFTGQKVSLGPDARFGSDVSYWRPEGEMDFGQAAVAGQVSFDPKLKGRKHHYSTLPSSKSVRKGMLSAMGGFFLLSLLSGIIVIIASILIFKGVFRQAGEILHRSYWQSTGIGLLVLILLPVMGMLALATIIGIPVGLLFLALFFFSVLFGRVVAAMTFAAWLERRKFSEWSTGRLLLVSVGLFTAIKLVSIIPFIGWVAVLFVVCAGFGALVTRLWKGSVAI